MKIFYFVAVALLANVAFGVCNLQNFPSQIHSADNLINLLNIDSYVEDHYPNLNKNLTSPIQVETNYHTVDFSKSFVGGCPYPNFVRTVFGEDQVSFELFNIETEIIVNTSSKYPLPDPSECRFFCMGQTNILVASTLLIQCRNATHQRDYSIVWFLRESTRIEQANIFPLNPMIRYNDIYRYVAYQGYPNLRTLFVNYRSEDKNVRIDYYSTSSLPIRARSFDDAFYEEIKRALGITTNLNLVDFKIINLGSDLIQLFLDTSEGLFIRYSYLNYRWMVNGQSFLKVVTFCQSNNVAVITNRNIYFLAIYLRKVDYRLEVFVEELTKVQNNGHSKEYYSIGGYLVASNSTVWNLLKLIGPQVSDSSFLRLGINANNQKYTIKAVSYSFQKSQKDIYIDDSCCKTNSFFTGKQRFVIKPETIINAGNEGIKTIQLETDVCSKEIVLRRHQLSEIEEINAKENIIWWQNETLIINHEVCIGHNLTKSLIINDRSYSISQFIKQSLTFPGKVVDFLHLTDHLNAVVTLENSEIKLFRCYNSQCSQIKSFLSSIRKIILRKISISPQHFLFQNPKSKKMSNEASFVFSFLTNTYEIYTEMYITFENQIMSLGGWQTYKTRIIYDYQLLELTEQQFSKDVTSFFIASGQKFITNSWAHIQFNNRGSSVHQMEDIFINYKKLCSLSVRNCILYQISEGTLNLALVRDVNGYFIPQRFQNITNLGTNNQKPICTQFGLAVSNFTSILFISEELTINHKLQVSQPIIDFKVSGKLLIIKKLKSIEIYNIESGFLLQELKEADFDKITTNRQSNFIIFENGTTLQLNQQPIIYNVQKPENIEVLQCSNNHNSISKLKNIVKRQLNGKLPQTDLITIPSSKFIDDFWNATISNVSILTNGSVWTRQSHFQHIDSSFQRYYTSSLIEESTIRLEISNEIVGIYLINNYYQSLADYDWSYLALHQDLQKAYYIIDNTYKQSSTASFFLGFTDVLKSNQSDSITFLSQNSSHFKFDILTFKENFTQDYKVENKTVLCESSTWVSWEYFLQDRLFMDGIYVYLLRHQEPQWNSIFSQPKNKEQFIRPYRRVIANPKIQIFKIDGCKLDEITNEKLGLHKIVDFKMVIKKSQSFIIVLTTEQIAILKYPQQQNMFSAKINHQFVRLDIKQNFLLLISAREDSQLYQIHWQSFPFPGTLQLQTSLAKANYEEITSGVILEGKIVLASTQSLFLYHITSNKRLFSAETLNAYYDLNTYYEHHGDNCFIEAIKTNGRDLIEFTVVFYIETFNGYMNYFKEQKLLNVSSYLYLQDSKQIKVKNERYEKIYDIKYGKTYVLSNLRTSQQQ